MTTKIYLTRHGETRWNKTQRLQGQLDSSLTSVGQQQSQQVAVTLQASHIDIIVSSPLGRAQQSATIYQRHLAVPLLTVNELAERNLGDWQGQQVASLSGLVDYQEILHQVTNLTVPNGESALACANRIEQCLLTLAKRFEHKHIVVVFHGEALRCLLHTQGSNSNNNAFELYKNGCIVELNYLTNPARLSLA